jgi:sterol desaturase/sphingolipid hydroxylase (fatty acid hydroxylase superfamily)
VRGVNAIADFLSVLPAQMRDPVLFAIPFFLLLLILEWTAARKLERIEREANARAAKAGGRPPRPGAGAYLTPDSWASIWMGLVSVATTAGWKFLALLGYAAIYAYLAPWQLPATRWYTWVVAILGVDLLYYCYHRTAHRVRLIWATHQAHHSSQYFNFATALRQKWNNSGEILMWMPLPLLGIPPWMVFVSFSINLIYQFWVHTERIGRMWPPFEYVFNTPSHHRVHHGMDPEYLDKNYGGILIVWDRLFGTFRRETFRPHYGLTKQVNTFNVWTLQTHEYRAIARDMRSATRLRDRLGYIFGPPGWAPRTAGGADVSARLATSR